VRSLFASTALVAVAVMSASGPCRAKRVGKETWVTDTRADFSRAGLAGERVRTITVDPRHDAIGIGSRRIARLSGGAFFVIQIKSISSTRR
jgi:hypothetical protein